MNASSEIEAQDEVISSLEATDSVSEEENKIKATLKKICQHESGCVYNKANYTGAGAYGAYQFMPLTYKNVAKKYCGINNPDWSIEMQDKIALCYAKKIYEKNKSLEDIACVWYSGKYCSDIKYQGWYNTKQSHGGVVYPSVAEYVNKTINL